MIEYEDTDGPKLGEWDAPAGFKGRPAHKPVQRNYGSDRIPGLGVMPDGSDDDSDDFRPY